MRFEDVEIQRADDYVKDKEMMVALKETKRLKVRDDYKT